MPLLCFTLINQLPNVSCHLAKSTQIEKKKQNLTDAPCESRDCHMLSNPELVGK